MVQAVTNCKEINISEQVENRSSALLQWGAAFFFTCVITFILLRIGGGSVSSESPSSSARKLDYLYWTKSADRAWMGMTSLETPVPWHSTG